VRRRLLIVLAMLSAAGFAPQAGERIAPPVDTAGPGGFTVRRLPGRPGIDGRAWMFVDVHTGRPPVFRPAGADYELRFTDPDNEGDFERWAVMLERPGRRPVSLTAGGKSGFAYVTPDARYVFTEPLILVDVKTWRRYALYAALGIKPYVTIVAISRDGRSLFIERRDCAQDCAGQTGEEYFELTLPQ
jgi:hypothetical protein